MAAPTVKGFVTDHKDLIHDVCYDYYGERMATCSSDQMVKVWEKAPTGDWTCTATWKAHTGSIWRVTWAHPEFGHVIATCSFDRTCALWEELVSISGTGDAANQNKSWVKKHQFVDSRTSVSDVKFSPKHLGLQLATCTSTDGIVRIYEAPDVMNLSQWQLQLEINVKLSCSSLSWCSAILTNPIIAVGSDDTNTANGGKVFLYELSEGMRKYTKIDTIHSVTDAVQDVSFAPNLGRLNNLLAIASKDLTIVMLKNTSKDLAGTIIGSAKFDQRLVAHFDQHNSTVWRLCWNVTGTTLASTGDDGCIRLWKSNYLGEWKSCGVLKGDGTKIEKKSSPASINLPVTSNSMEQSSSMDGYQQASAQTKRNSGWPYFNTQKDIGKAYY